MIVNHVNEHRIALSLKAIGVKERDPWPAQWREGQSVKTDE